MSFDNSQVLARYRIRLIDEVAHPLAACPRQQNQPFHFHPRDSASHRVLIFLMAAASQPFNFSNCPRPRTPTPGSLFFTLSAVPLLIPVV